MGYPQPGWIEDYGRVFMLVPDILGVFGFNGRCTVVNPAWSSILGFRPDEVRGKFYLEFVHPEDQAQSGIAFRRLATGDSSVIWHNRYQRKDGKYRNLQWHATSDLTRREIYAVARDITDLMVNDELLRESELKSLSTIEHAFEGVLRTSPGGQVIMVNPAAVKMLGYESEADLIGKGSDFIRDLYVDKEDREVLTENLAREGVVKLECPFYRKDRSVFWVALKARAVRHGSGALSYIEMFLKDITPQVQMEEAIRISDGRYRTLVENAPFGIYRISLDGQFEDVNHALVAMLGYESREEVMMLNIEADVYVDPRVRTQLIKQFGDVERIESAAAEWKRKDGTLILVRLSARKIRDAYGVLEGFEVVAHKTD